MTFGGIWPTAASQGGPSASGAEIFLIFLAAGSVGAAISLVQEWEGRDGGERMEAAPGSPVLAALCRVLFQTAASSK